MPSRSSRSLVDMVRQRDATMEEVALLIARDRYPHLSLDHYTRHLDRMAAPLQARMDEGMELDERAHMLLGYVFGELGFRGDRQTYHDPDNSYLNRVLERRAGIPISLAVVLMALGRRMRLRVEGINFPGHFLVRIGGEPGTVVDPFEGKGPLDREYLTALARKVLGPKARLRDEHLAPATLKVMATRMLLNLKQIYGQGKQHSAALLVCDRLYDLTRDARYRRDRGMHAFALGARQAAAEDWQAYLDVRPRAADAAELQRLLREVRRSRLTLQ